MIKKKLLEGSKKDILVAVGPPLLLAVVIIVVAYKFIDPAPPKHFIISTGEKGDDFNFFAKQYKDILKEDGVNLEIRETSGNWENLHLLKDEKTDVDAGFVEDGLGSAEQAPDLSSIGSLYYEPLWFFYNGKSKITRLSHFMGKTLAIGRKGGGAHTLSQKILKASGLSAENTKFLEIGREEAALALENKKVDGAIFLGTPDDKLILGLIKNKNIHLVSLDQAEAISRQFPYLHHLVLPHGALDLKENIPDQDIDLVSPTATLLVRDDLHPALIYLLLKAASQVHGDPGIFEKKNEFPSDKDSAFPLADEAKTYYKSGAPFWQRYLPFWLATLVDRFILLVIPLLAILIPVARLVPKILEWRVKSRIYQRYGELKFLETTIKPEATVDTYRDYLSQLEGIENRVNDMKVPVGFSDYFYALRGHIHFVRERILKLMGSLH